jgi:hypothetical protein
MLLEIVFGLRASPGPVELHFHVASVVQALLRGACPGGRPQALRIVNDGRRSETAVVSSALGEASLAL